MTKQKQKMSFGAEGVGIMPKTWIMETDIDFSNSKKENAIYRMKRKEG